MDRKIADFFIRQDGTNLKFFPKFNKIKKVIKTAIKNNEKAFRFIDNNLKKDSTFIKELLKLNSYVYDEISEKTFDLSFFLIDKIDSQLFIKLPVEHKKDKKILLRYLQDHELNDTSIDLKDYPDLFEKKEYINLLLKHNGNLFSTMPQHVIVNKEYARIALRSGASIFDLPNNLLNEYSVAEVAVKINGRWIEEFSEEIKADYDIARKAVENDPRSIKFISKDLRSNSELIKISLKKDGSAINYLNSEDRSNEAYLILAAINCPKILKTIDNSDLDFWEKVLSNNPDSYEFFPNIIKNNRNLALMAIELEPKNIKFIKMEFKLNEKFLIIALEHGINLSEIDDLIVFSDFVTDNPLLLKELILSNPSNFFNTNSLNPELHKDLLFEILDHVQIPIWQLNSEFFQDKKILEKTLETQNIDVTLETFLYGNEDYILKAVKNNSEIILNPFNGFIPVDEDFLFKCIQINPSIIDEYYEVDHINLSSKFVKKLIRDYPSKIDTIFNRFDKFITKEIVLEAINYTGKVLKDKYGSVNTNFNFLRHLPNNLKSDFEIILRYIFVGGNNLEFFNFSLKEITSILMIHNYSSSNYLQAKLFENTLENNVLQKNFFEIVSDMFSFPNVISAELVRSILNNNQHKLEIYLKNSSIHDELHFLMECICFQELYFNDFNNKIYILKMKRDIVSPKKINYFIDLIRSVILEAHYKHFGDTSIIKKLFPEYSIKNFDLLKEELFRLLNVEDKSIKESTIIFIKKSFNITIYKTSFEKYQSEFYFSEDYSILFLNSVAYKISDFFMKDSKIALRKTTDKYYDKFFKSLDYLLKNKSITRDIIKDIFKMDSSKFNNLFNHRLKDRFQIFVENFNYIFLEEGYELIIDWKVSKDEPLIKVKISTAS